MTDISTEWKINIHIKGYIKLRRQTFGQAGAKGACGVWKLWFGGWSLDRYTRLP